MESPPIFILANDNVLARFLMLAASLRYFKFTNTVYVIPFDQNISTIQRLAHVLGYTIWDTGVDLVHSFGRRLYDSDPPANPYPKCLGNLHKMAFLNYPGTAVYLDSDIVMTCEPMIFNAVFGSIASTSERLRVGFINTSPTGVYEENDESRAMLARSPLFCAGILAKAEGTLSIQSIEQHFTDSQIQLYHRIRRRGGHVDQPVWNFMADTGLIDAVDLLTSNQASRVTSPNQKGLVFNESGSATIGGRQILLFHMAGPLLKTTQGCKFFWQGMLWEGMQILRDAGMPEWQAILAATDKLR